MPPTDSSPHLYTALSAPAAPPALLRLVPSLLATLLPGSLFLARSARTQGAPALAPSLPLSPGWASFLCTELRSAGQIQPAMFL